jgi:hypothetical protein
MNHPGQAVFSANNMDVQMENFLSTDPARIDDSAETIRTAMFFRYFRRQ